MNKLSICIPTYNREEYLVKLLDSIFSQIDNDNKDLIQICISDNCSTDNTKKIIEEYMISTNIEVIFNINESNIGPDLNFLKVVEIATGDYCWLMGSDDFLKENALNLVISKLNNSPTFSVLLGNRDECDKELVFRQHGFWLNPKITELDVDFSEKDQIIDYFKKCRSLGGIFSFLSSIIVKKSEWDNVRFDLSFVGTAYSHVFMIFSILNNSKKMKYFSDSIVKCRLGNDSFFKNQKQRVFLDLNGYLRLFELFNNYTVRNEGLKILIKEHPQKCLYTICLNEKFQPKDIRVLKEIGYSSFSISLICIFTKFNYFFNKLRPAYRFLNFKY